MADHSLSPATASEVDALVQRLGELRARVLLWTEWYSLFSATRQLLPRDGKKSVLEPAEVDLAAYAWTTAGRVLSALAGAFVFRDTYLANSRYTISQWIFLIREFYALCPYVLPPPRLEYATELLRKAREVGEDEFWSMASIIVRSEPIAVSQVVKDANVDARKTAILDGLRGLNEQGAGFLQASRHGQSIDPDEYADWRYRSEEILPQAKQFLSAFYRLLPTEIEELTSLIQEVPRPLDEEEADPDEDEGSIKASNYWTIERIFEDL